jgi:hypothetical protein
LEIVEIWSWFKTKMMVAGWRKYVCWMTVKGFASVEEKPNFSLLLYGHSTRMGGARRDVLVTQTKTPHIVLLFSLLVRKVLNQAGKKLTAVAMRLPAEACHAHHHHNPFSQSRHRGHESMKLTILAIRLPS